MKSYTFHTNYTMLKELGIDIFDADADVIFETEREDLTSDTYERLKGFALKPAKDFWT